MLNIQIYQDTLSPLHLAATSTILKDSIRFITKYFSQRLCLLKRHGDPQIVTLEHARNGSVQPESMVSDNTTEHDSAHYRILVGKSKDVGRNINGFETSLVTSYIVGAIETVWQQNQRWMSAATEPNIS